MSFANTDQTSMPHGSLSRLGLQMLLQSHDYANELARDIWDFAVELPVLQKAGLSSSDLRWLVYKEFAQHAREITAAGDSGRFFEHQKNLALRKRSCFVLTSSGADFLRNAVTQLDMESEDVLQDREWSMLGDTNGHCDTNGERLTVRTADSIALLPTWDCDRQELRLGTKVVKEFKLHSPNQAMILSSFEEEGWPAKIDDPLPPHAEIDVKQRLHDTIKSLNRHQRCELIRFRGDGTGQGIRWELRAPISQDLDSNGNQSDFTVGAIR